MNDTLTALRGVLSTTASRWQHLIDTLPESALARTPAPGEWSAVACLTHLLTAEQVLFSVRLRRLLEGREQLIPIDASALNDPGPARTPRELAAAFASARKESEALLAGLTPPDLARSSHHPEYGAVTLAYQLNLWAAHDLQHTVQAEVALMQTFIPHTGVFRFEFAAQDIEALQARP